MKTLRSIPARKRAACWGLAVGIVFSVSAKPPGTSDETSRTDCQATYADGIPRPETGVLPGWQRGKVLYREDFDGSLDNWVSELTNPTASSVVPKNSRLEATIKGGATIWFKPELSGNIQIAYAATVVSHSPNGANLNLFWMASDPVGGRSLFTRQGKFAQYDTLRLYYAGLGGGDNTTTRFRKYLGDGTKPIVQEHADAAHRPVAGKTYLIQISVCDGRTQLAVNGETYFDWQDTDPYPKGHFAFRLFQGQINYDNFTVYRLERTKAR